MEHFDSVDDYLDCAELWPDEIRALRPVLLGSGLTESVKWGKPCYSHDGANIALVQEFKEFLALMFFKGALLDDPEGVLHDQGPNSRSARRMQFTSVEEVRARAGVVEAYLDEAVRAEEAGLELPPPPELELVAELQARLDADPELRAAFEGLTPGRQREYHLHISSAKQAATRESRIDKLTPKILAGKGMRDR
jgi:uncharacterized protein YdeI (YjbR/CyaY-like superfamily)